MDLNRFKGHIFIPGRRVVLAAVVGFLVGTLSATAACGESEPSATLPATLSTSPQSGVTAPSSSTVSSTLGPGQSTPPLWDLAGADLNQLRADYTPELCEQVLRGEIEAPTQVVDALKAALGKTRFNELRAGASASGQEKDICAVVLWRLQIAPETLRSVAATAGFSVERVDSQYRVAPANLSGWFTSGQEADLMLSGIDFNKTGGPLFFNHPKGIATDGRHLLLADGNNNRVLIWKNLPDGNTPPDLVLGQDSFETNYPGTGRDQMNWPVSVATDGTRVVVADTYNHRILIWNQFPRVNGAPADIVLDGRPGFKFGKATTTGFSWPWGVWTDGKRLVVSSTEGGYVLVWNTFPTRDNQPADFTLTASGKFGTPRHITSDGTCLIVGDHNAKDTGSSVGAFVWKSFPTKNDQPFDYFLPAKGAWMRGTFAPSGKLVMLGDTLCVWDMLPQKPEEQPALSITGFRFQGGDGSGVAIAQGKVYVSLYNGNRVVVYNQIPTKPNQRPDFAIGAKDVDTNTLETEYFITNAMPLTDGKSLFVSSDFDRKLYVWKQIPDESGARPDLVYSLPEEPWDNALQEDTLVLAGKKTVIIWKHLPLDGQLPDQVITGSLGGVTFKDLDGVALDDRYFYLSDREANKVYVWRGLPENDAAPAFALEVQAPGRLSSDGRYLVVTCMERHAVLIYDVKSLSASSKPLATIGGPGKFNLPQNAIVSHGALFIADTNFSRVWVWKSIAQAIAGKGADVTLGKGGPGIPPQATRDQLFWPAGLAFDGSYLWVGEFKFSFRLLRFSVR
ncbi:MAG: hypothetical protein N3B14_00785 [Thermoleophilia bacterium]|nr:hypothetical protein [Thermoleophilia bacterium]